MSAKPSGAGATVTPLRPAESTAEPEVAAAAVSAADSEAVLAPVEERPRIDLRAQGEPWRRRYEAGAAMRRAMPPEVLAAWEPAVDRPDPIATVEASEAGRQAQFLPLRRERMAESAFAFLRGSAGIMAADLAAAPRTGIEVVVCGDAHIANFGLFGTPTGDVVLDLNDFDEVGIGPWEHDLMRLTASIAVAGEDAGLGHHDRDRAVRAAVEGYRTTMRRLAPAGAADVWAEATHLEHGTVDVAGGCRGLSSPEARRVIRAAVDRARRRGSRDLLKRSGERRVDGGWRIALDPPVMTKVEPDVRETVITALERYAETLPRERRYMLQRYRAVDVAHRVVGVGSVGLRAYLALLFGNSDRDALFIQVKEAVAPAARPYLPPQPKGWATGGHEGERVVVGQRLLQAVGDPLLGWTSVASRPAYVRQMRNLKGDLELPWAAPRTLRLFLHAYGALLARAHARTGDAAAIAGWCGDDGALDDALAAFAGRYARQVRADRDAYAASLGG